MNILVTGSTGFLGPYLMQEFDGPSTNCVGVSRSRNADYQCDLTDPAQVATMMHRFKPELVIHAAAMTDVEKCQKEPALAVSINCKATENVVDFAPDGSRIIYISTDQIYSGAGPHKEHSRSENPINMYGMSKYMGEFAAGRRGNYLIVRTNMFGFSKTGSKSSLADSLYQKFKSGNPVSLFTDLMFSPLNVKTLCKFIARMAITGKNGTYNLGSTGGMSKAKFAMILAYELKLPPYSAMPADSMAIQDRTPRPSDTRLDISRVESAFGLTMPTLENEIREMCKEHQCAH